MNINISNQDSEKTISPNQNHPVQKETQQVAIIMQRFNIPTYLIKFGTSKEAIIFSPFKTSEICDGIWESCGKD